MSESCNKMSRKMKKLKWLRAINIAVVLALVAMSWPITHPSPVYAAATYGGSRIADNAGSWQATEDVDVTGWDKANTFIFAIGLDGEDGVPLADISELYIVEMEEPPDPPEDVTVIGLVYDIGPDGATFSEPIILTFLYEEPKIPEGIADENLVLVTWDIDIEQWVPLEVYIVVPENNTIRGIVSHLTPFAIHAYPQPPSFAAFAAGDLLVTPTEVDIGETINIVVLVSNTGGQPGTYEVTLRMDGLVEASKNVALNPGESKLIGFDTVKDTAGTYLVEVEGLLSSFTVREKPVAPPLPAPVAPVAPAAPEPVTDAFGYIWLMVISAVATVTAIVAFISIRARRRLQRVTIVEGAAEVAEGAVRIDKLQIRPNLVKPGEAVTIIAEAISAISIKTSYSLVLKIRNVVEAITEMSLSPRGSQKAVFTVIKDKPGVYDIDLEGLKGNFVVEGVPLPPPPAALEPVAEVVRYRWINAAISTVVMKAAFVFATARERLVVIAASVVMKAAFVFYTARERLVVIAALAGSNRRINAAISIVVMKAAFVFSTLFGKLKSKKLR